jgi:hypothetical protein
MKQITRQTGNRMRFNLDPYSVRALRNAKKHLKDAGNPIPHSAIARRALRVYYKLLQKLQTPEAIATEDIETQRAAKGIL